MEAYKVFYVDPDGNIFSSNRGLNGSFLWQQYFSTQENFPKFQFPILCFDTYDNAYDFFYNECDGMPYFEIWKVKGELDFIPDRLASPCNLLNCMRVKSFDDVLKELNFPDSSIVRDCPEGCVGLKSIELIEKNR